MKTNMNIKKEKLILIASAFITVIFIGLLIYLIFFVSSEPTSNNLFSDEVSDEVTTSAQVNFDNQGFDKLYEIATSDSTLSIEEQAIKESLYQVGDEYSSGTIYTSEKVDIGYISEPDIFQANIKTLNIAEAKTEAVNFFTSKGLTKASVCKLPLMFVLDFSLLEEFKKSGRKFSPLPPGC